MNDDLITSDLITRVREPFADVHMAAPADTVIARGRSIRRRRRVAAITVGAAAVVTAAVLATVATLPGSRPGHVSLTAWTVVTQPSGTVAVTIHDLRDPAGLQRALRAHGVPAAVRYYQPGMAMPSCVTRVPSRLAAVERRVFGQGPTTGHGRYLLLIHPAAVPAADMIAIQAVRGTGLSIGLVTRDGRCPPGSGLGSVGIGGAGSGHS